MQPKNYLTNIRAGNGSLDHVSLGQMGPESQLGHLGHLLTSSYEPVT